ALENMGKPVRTIGSIQISPDGTHLAMGRIEASQVDVWVVDLVHGSETRLTTDPSSDQDPVWSPDGKRIAFTSDRAGTQNLYLRFADGGGNDELLLKTGERKQPRAWSPDGRFLLFGVASPKSLDVWVLPMDAGSAEERKPIPYLRTDANER